MSELPEMPEIRSFCEESRYQTNYWGSFWGATFQTTYLSWLPDTTKKSIKKRSSEPIRASYFTNLDFHSKKKNSLNTKQYF